MENTKITIYKLYINDKENYREDIKKKTYLFYLLVK